MRGWDLNKDLEVFSQTNFRKRKQRDYHVYGRTRKSGRQEREERADV